MKINNININIHLGAEVFFNYNLLEILERYTPKGVIHCFSGNLDFAKKINAPIFADILSQMRHIKSNKNVFTYYDNYLNEIRKNPDLIIRFGDKPTSKELNILIDRCKSKTFLIDDFKRNNAASFSNSDLFISVEKYFIAYDIGRAINPMLVEGQLVGGLAQGIGGSLYEEFTYSEDGDPLSVTFADYLIPTLQEIPEPEILLTEDYPSIRTPLGIKGAGEAGITGSGAAIASAIARGNWLRVFCQGTVFRV